MLCFQFASFLFFSFLFFSFLFFSFLLFVVLSNMPTWAVGSEIIFGMIKGPRQKQESKVKIKEENEGDKKKIHVG